MMKYLKESILWAFIALPYVYLSSIWDKLPEHVPTHFSLDGSPNDWSSKTTLLFAPGLLVLGIYLLMLFLPRLDPKRKIEQMGEKYFSFRLILTFFFSLLATHIIYTASVGSITHPSLLYAILGFLFVGLGNYFQTIRPNYFIGIRTPWTLENEKVWKKTHRISGPIWIFGGILIAILSFFINKAELMGQLFAIILIIMMLIPVVFSYTEFQKEK